MFFELPTQTGTETGSAEWPYFRSVGFRVPVGVGGWGAGFAWGFRGCGAEKGRYKTTWKRKFKLLWQKACPLKLS